MPLIPEFDTDDPDNEDILQYLFYTALFISIVFAATILAVGLLL